MEMPETTMLQLGSKTTTMNKAGSNLATEETFKAEIILELLLPFLRPPQLAAVARTNRRFLQLVQNRNELWACTYAHWDQEYRMAPLRILTQDDFHDPDDFVRFEMRVPPLMTARPATNGEGDDIGPDNDHSNILSSPLHGAWSRRLWHGRDREDPHYSNCCLVPRKRSRTALEYSNSSHSTDTHGDNATLYFTDFGVYCHWRVDEDGNLLDSPSNKSSLWARREYPVQCQDCQVTLHNTRQLVDHCSSPMHIYCKCPALLDPRRKADFESLSFYQKAKAIWHYPKNIESFFGQQVHQPPNQYRMHQFLGLLEGTIAHVLQRDSIIDSSKHLYPERNVQQVSQYCVKWIVHKALHFDFCNYSKQVACVGWQAIDFYESGIGYDLCLSLTGIPPHHFDYLIKD